MRHVERVYVHCLSCLSSFNVALFLFCHVGASSLFVNTSGKLYYVVFCDFCRSQEAFTSAKLAFASYKARVRTNLVTTHVGPETLDEAVQDYINRNTDLYDLPGLVNVRTK